MTPDERLRVHNEMLQSLVEKGRLLLEVNVSSTEQAEQLIEWMYAPEKPMKAELLRLSWNQALVTQKEYDALQQLKAALLDC